jgi:hypothetical protein
LITSAFATMAISAPPASSKVLRVKRNYCDSLNVLG